MSGFSLNLTDLYFTMGNPAASDLASENIEIFGGCKVNGLIMGEKRRCSWGFKIIIILSSLFPFLREDLKKVKLKRKRYLQFTMTDT